MMQEFAEFGDELQEFLARNPKPVPSVKFFAMKKGEVRKFDTFFEAKEFSPLVEKVIDDADLRAWELAKAHFVAKQVSAWRAALRAQHAGLSDTQFAALFAYANDKTETYDDHADLMDEIAAIFKA